MVMTTFALVLTACRDATTGTADRGKRLRGCGARRSESLQGAATRCEWCSRRRRVIPCGATSRTSRGYRNDACLAVAADRSVAKLVAVWPPCCADSRQQHGACSLCCMCSLTGGELSMIKRHKGFVRRPNAACQLDHGDLTADSSCR